MAQDKRTDPYLAFNFLVEIKGLVVGGFSEVTGLRSEIEVKDYREGGQNDYVHKLAGPTRYPSNLILKHGLTYDETLYDWYWKVTMGFIERRNVSIILLDNSREEVGRFNFVQAYPVRWVGPDLRAGTVEVAVETLELVHCGLFKA